MRNDRDIEVDTGEYRSDVDYVMNYYDDDCVKVTNSYHNSYKRNAGGIL